MMCGRTIVVVIILGYSSKRSVSVDSRTLLAGAYREASNKCRGAWKMQATAETAKFEDRASNVHIKAEKQNMCTGYNFCVAGPYLISSQFVLPR